MGAWLTFLKERIPAFSYLLLATGLAASGVAINKLSPSAVPGSSVPWIVIAIPAVGAFLFFAVLRIMDEYKDYDKDRIAHPQRPLPRGVLAPAQVARAVNGLVILMLIYAFAVGLANRPAGLSYLLVTGYLWLMYREFYAGAWLSDRPILYAASHQVILLPLCYFSVLVFDAIAWHHTLTFAFGATVLGAFFTYEICRKLDPHAHPLAQTYLSHYGPARTLIFAVCTVALSAVGALGLGLGPLLWPLEAIMVALLALVFIAPHRFKTVENAASISLALHVWAVALSVWLDVAG